MIGRALLGLLKGKASTNHLRLLRPPARGGASCHESFMLVFDMDFALID
jgi:hypothetical protein